MRIVLLTLLLAFSLYAKRSESCYTVQLQSMLYSDENLKSLQAKNFPPECSLMRISKALTVRCGCYEGYSVAKKKLPKYKKQYKYAYIATSYKYRFKSKAPSKKELSHPSHKAYSNDEELKLMLQAFLYSNDLEHAYQTAKLGYKKHPNSIYWNQKMAEICKWSGRSRESIKYMKFLYFKKHDPKLAKEIIDFGLGTYQYEQLKELVTQEVKRSPSKENIEMMAYIYSQLGEPEEAAALFEKFYEKDNTHPEYLDKALQLYMQSGNLDAAQKIVHIIEQKSLYSFHNIKLIAYFYYSKRSVEHAFKTLTQITETKEYDKQYLQLLSDLGWYLEHFKAASAASLELIGHNDGRLVDYERVIAFEKQHNKELAAKMSLKAYKKFHLSYLFYLFANEMIHEKDLSSLRNAIAEIDKEKESPLQRDAHYWLLKAMLYHKAGEEALTKEALQKAIALKPNSLEIRFSVLSYYQDFEMYDALRQELANLSTDITLPHEFYFAMASFAFAVHDINLANYYMQQLISEKNPLIHSTAFEFLQADIYTAKNNHNAAMQIIEKITKQLKDEKRQNPHLAKENQYRYNLLRAEMQLLTSDDFSKKLEESKPYLSKAYYDDLRYSLALKNNSLEKANEIYHQTAHKAIWLQFSNALNEQNHSQIENLLASYLYTLASDDAAYGAQQDGQIALAQSMSYTSLEHNDDNQNAYISLLDLVKQRTNLSSVKTAYYLRDPLLRKYVTLHNSNYLNKSYYLLSDLNYYRNSDLDKNILRKVPTDTTEFNLGVKKVFGKGELSIMGGYANSMDSYLLYSLAGKYRLTKELTIGGGFYKNIKTDESTQLLLGGKKDKLELNITYQILNSTAFDVLYEHNNYNSQDDVALGSGEYMRVNLSRQIRNGYPDMRLALFSDGAFYDEKEGTHGVIDKLQSPRAQVLPNNFMNFGIDFAYGMQNSDIYTRVWRPYFEVSSYYNTDLAAFSYGFNAGYGGKVYSQDHLVIGTSYTNSVNGIGGSIFELFLNYKFLYTH